MKNLWRAFKLVLPHRGMLAWYAFTALMLGIFSAAPIVLFKAFMSRLEHKDAPTPDQGYAGSHIDGFLTSVFRLGRDVSRRASVLLLALFLFNNVFEFLNSYIASWLAQRMRVEAMTRMMSKLLTLDQPFFDKQKTGDLVARMVSDGEHAAIHGCDRVLIGTSRKGALYHLIKGHFQSRLESVLPPDIKVQVLSSDHVPRRRLPRRLPRQRRLNRLPWPMPVISLQ